MAHLNVLHSNFDVDYVISYRFTNTGTHAPLGFQLLLIDCTAQGKSEAQDGLEKLLQALARVGLAMEVRNGDNCALLVFVKVASGQRLSEQVYRSR